jgi:hypothetical protein
VDCCFLGLAEVLNGLDEGFNGLDEVRNKFSKGLNWLADVENGFTEGLKKLNWGLWGLEDVVWSLDYED